MYVVMLIGKTRGERKEDWKEGREEKGREGGREGGREEKLRLVKVCGILLVFLIQLSRAGYSSSLVRRVGVQWENVWCVCGVSGVMLVGMAGEPAGRQCVCHLFALGQ